MVPLSTKLFCIRLQTATFRHRILREMVGFDEKRFAKIVTPRRNP